MIPGLVRHGGRVHPVVARSIGGARLGAAHRLDGVEVAIAVLDVSVEEIGPGAAVRHLPDDVGAREHGVALRRVVGVPAPDRSRIERIVGAQDPVASDGAVGAADHLHVHRDVPGIGPVGVFIQVAAPHTFSTIFGREPAVVRVHRDGFARAFDGQGVVEGAEAVRRGSPVDGERVGLPLGQLLGRAAAGVDPDLHLVGANLQPFIRRRRLPVAAVPGVAVGQHRRVRVAVLSGRGNGNRPSPFVGEIEGVGVAFLCRLSRIEAGHHDAAHGQGLEPRGGHVANAEVELRPGRVVTRVAYGVRRGDRVVHHDDVCLGRRRGKGQHHLTAAHGDVVDRYVGKADPHGEGAGRRHRPVVEQVVVGQGDLVAQDYEVGQHRSGGVDFRAVEPEVQHPVVPTAGAGVVRADPVRHRPSEQGLLVRPGAGRLPRPQFPCARVLAEPQPVRGARVQLDGAGRIEEGCILNRRDREAQDVEGPHHGVVRVLADIQGPTAGTARC